MRSKIDAQKRELKATKKAPATGTPAHTIKAVANYLSGTALEFVKTQILMSNRNRKGRRYSKPTRRLALSIYFRNSRTYAFLRKIFALPSRRMLRNYVSNYSSGIGFNNFALSVVKKNLENREEKDRVCLLSLDAMEISQGIS